MENYTQHIIGKIMPSMNEEEFASLKQDIATNGLTNDTITIYQGQILDGWHRYQACVSGSVTFTENQFTGDSPITFVLSNANRRNLTAGQKAAIAFEVLPMLEAEAKARQATSTGGKKPQLTAKLQEAAKGESTEKAAKITGASARYVAEVKKIAETNPELVKDIKADKLTIKDAKNIIYKENQLQLKDTSNVTITSDSVKLYHCDILDSPLADESLDVIVTDPPYPREYLDCWTKLAQFAVKKLKKDGVLIALSGQSYLPEVYRNMTIEGLNYYWMGCISTEGPSANLHTKRLQTKWKPFLFYVKGEYTKTHQKTDVYNTVYQDTAKGQEFHKWGQSLPIMKQLVEDYSYADDVICDPFLGGGTTGIAAVQLKRKFVGIELLKSCYNTASDRIAYALKGVK